MEQFFQELSEFVSCGQLIVKYLCNPLNSEFDGNFYHKYFVTSDNHVIITYQIINDEKKFISVRTIKPVKESFTIILVKLLADFLYLKHNEPQRFNNILNRRNTVTSKERLILENFLEFYHNRFNGNFHTLSRVDFFNNGINPINIFGKEFIFYYSSVMPYVVLYQGYNQDDIEDIEKLLRTDYIIKSGIFLDN
jgi:hypothetical protein